MLFCSLALTFACSNQPMVELETPETPEPTQLQITKFTLKSPKGDYVGEINEQTNTITVLVPVDFNIKKVRIDVEYTEGAELKPESGYEYNFSQPVVFKLFKAGNKKEYTVIVGTRPEFLHFDLPQFRVKGNVTKEGIIELKIPYGADITSVVPEFSVPAGCEVIPRAGETVDLTKKQTYKVTNAAGISMDYICNISFLPQEKQIRGVWVPDPTHTDVLMSGENLKEFISLVDELNLNAIYLAVWVREKTLFRSNVLLKHTNWKSQDEGCLLTGADYHGRTDDPIADLITMAHEKGIKVFFWFEYGFMRSGRSDVNVSSHPILSVHPEWDGINNNGSPSNYNNTDFYLNSYNPEVQEFILDLVKESISLYPEVDGIQGDDRMPAAPRNSGYNPETKALYKKETGKDVPTNYQDAAWVKWRLDKLNAFGKRLYDEVKSVKSSLLVSFSPNPYPWCEQNLMQDWPSWLKGGYADILSVQCYRDSETAYKYTLNEVMGYVQSSTDRNICNPGIYLRSGKDWEKVFISQMQYNREKGTNGESFFFNNGLKLQVNKDVLKSFYVGKAVFPF